MKPKGGDASCQENPVLSTPNPGSNAAPTFNPKGRGMTVKKLIKYLEAFLPDTKVYIDWDYEIEATDVVYFLDGEREGIKIS